ncbi:hypothetical protein BGZ74_001781, partial [Mortierella antarctica]
MAPITRLAAAILVFSSVFVSAAPVLAPLAPNTSLNTDGAYGSSPSTESLEKRASYGQVFACKTPGTIAITFDDGPYMFTKDLLDELDKIPGSPKVTFFVNGSNNGKITDYASTCLQFRPPDCVSHLVTQGYDHLEPFCPQVRDDET